MLVNAEFSGLGVPSRFIAYANAFLSAAESQCNHMLNEPSARNWPSSAVILWLAAHAVELFLKGAIFSREPNASIEHHNIEALTVEYRRLCPEPELQWEIPFQVEYLGMTDAEIKEARKNAPQPSILYRYPVDRGGGEWNAELGFVPETFVVAIRRIKSDFERLRNQFT
jgi:hypothetical protein